MNGLNNALSVREQAKRIDAGRRLFYRRQLGSIAWQKEVFSRTILETKAAVPTGSGGRVLTGVIFRTPFMSPNDEVGGSDGPPPVCPVVPIPDIYKLCRYPIPGPIRSA